LYLTNRIRDGEEIEGSQMKKNCRVELSQKVGVPDLRLHSRSGRERTIRAENECVFVDFYCGRCAGAADGRLGDVVMLAVIVYDLLKLLPFTEVSSVAYIGRRSSDRDAKSVIKV
jgi:hypothetical protein